MNTTVEAGGGRTAGQQAGFQLAAVGVTLAIAIVTGALTGLNTAISFNLYIHINIITSKNRSVVFR